MKRARGYLLAFAAIAVVAFCAALFAGLRHAADWTGGSAVIALIIVLGTLATGLLGGGLMWLAFYSSRHGYDEPDDPRPPPR